MRQHPVAGRGTRERPGENDRHDARHSVQAAPPEPTCLRTGGPPLTF
jgi:hypothetical protein